MTLHLGECTLVSYDASKEEHLEYREELVGDKGITKYLKSIKSQLKKQKENLSIFHRAYLVKIGEEFVGYVYIFEPVSHEVDLHYAVDQNHRGYHYGAAILRATSSYLLNSFEEIEKVRLIVATKNIPSHRAAYEAGFGFDHHYTYYKEKARKCISNRK